MSANRLTLHNTEGNYLAHTQGKRHQQNLARRAFKDARDAPILPTPAKYVEKRHAIKIGRPGYKVTKSRDASSGQRALLFEVDYPEADATVQPAHRFVLSYEQRVEPPDKNYQYLLFACGASTRRSVSECRTTPQYKGEDRFFTNCTPAFFTLSLQFADGDLRKTTPAPGRWWETSGRLRRDADRERRGSRGPRRRRSGFAPAASSESCSESFLASRCRRRGHDSPADAGAPSAGEGVLRGRDIPRGRRRDPISRPPGLTEGVVFVAPASRERQSTRSNAGQAPARRGPATSRSPRAATRAARQGLPTQLTSNRAAFATTLHGSAPHKSHGRRAAPPRPRQRLAAAAPHARPGPRAGPISPERRREYRRKDPRYDALVEAVRRQNWACAKRKKRKAPPVKRSTEDAESQSTAFTRVSR